MLTKSDNSSMNHKMVQIWQSCSRVTAGNLSIFPFPVCLQLLYTCIHSFSHLTRTTLIESCGGRSDWISEDRVGCDGEGFRGCNGFHGLFTALNNSTGAALMGFGWFS